MSINLTKESTLSHESREQIQLICKDSSLYAKEKVKEIIHTEVRGGRGNARLLSWRSKDDYESSLESKELELLELLSEKSLYDYKLGSKQPKEWSNIEVGKDIYKFSRDEIHGMKNAGILSLVVSGSFLIAFFI